MSRDQLNPLFPIHKYVTFRHQLLDFSKTNTRSPAATVLQRKASMQQIGLPISASNQRRLCILTHFLTSQPALIKFDNENIGGHLTPLHVSLAVCEIYIIKELRDLENLVRSCSRSLKCAVR